MEEEEANVASTASRLYCYYFSTSLDRVKKKNKNLDEVIHFLPGFEETSGPENENF
jgi:hypothetical protein